MDHFHCLEYTEDQQSCQLLEPFGLTPLESMACQRPVIGSAVGGLPATIIPGVTGALVPPRDPVALAATLGDLLRHPQRLRRMGANGRQRVLQEYRWPIVAARTAALFDAVLAQRMAATPLASLWSLPALEDGEVEYGAH